MLLYSILLVLFRKQSIVDPRQTVGLENSTIVLGLLIAS